MGAELTLYAEASWMSPWVFHAMVALEEKQLSYELEVVALPIPPAQRDLLQQKALIGKVPILGHDDAWISESLAISEYLAERFPTPHHPRIFPADLVERAQARQVMSMLRTSLAALREDRPTSTVFRRPTIRPMSDAGKHDAAELVRIASALIGPGKTTMFAEWSIADADMTLALMRLVVNGDPVPSHVIDYALANWSRASIRTYLAHVPASR